MRRPVVLVLVAAALAGCGDRASIREGGKTPGDILTVYTLVPDTPAGTDLVRGAKLALAQAGGRVGDLTVQFASAREPGDDAEGVASAVRDIVRDTGTIAVIGDLDPRTARISGPLLNAVGFLHVSPIAPVSFPQPSARRNFFTFGATPDEQARAIVREADAPFAVEAEPDGEALAAAVRRAAGRTVATARARTIVYAGTDRESAAGIVPRLLRENPRARVVLPSVLAGVVKGPRVRALVTEAPPVGYGLTFDGDVPGPYATAGYDAMNAVLAALRRAGKRAQERPAVIEAFRAPAPARLVLR